MPLDGLLAVSLACDICEFIKLAKDVYGTSREINKNITGATEIHQELRVVATRTKSLNNSIVQSRLHIANNPKPSNAEERGFLEISADCIEAAHDLERTLDKLQLVGQRTVWKTVQQAIRTIRSEDEIEKKQKKLQLLQDLLIPHLIEIVSRSNERNFDAIFKNNLRMEQGILNAVQNAEQQTKRHVLDLERRIGETQQLSQKDLIRQQRVEYLQREKSERIKLLARTIPDAIEEAIHTVAVQKLLDSLEFERIKDRYMKIRQAHRQTFGWIYGQAQTSSKSPKLTDWFQAESNGKNIFWVTGKPGSGKSTLMKYLLDHEMTFTRLAQWAGSYKLLTASSFFWTSGNSMQRSLQGMLQTLLHTLLSQHRDLVEKTCPWRVRQFEFGSLLLESWTEEELLSAIQTFISLTKATHRICLFVDGLDEYEGSTKKSSLLIGVLKDLGSNDSVKLCVSSRPENAFTEAFKAAPTLLIEEYTEQDIFNYVNEELAEHPMFKDLQKIYPDQCAQLVHDIAGKAQGLFFWVYLVVQTLFQDLTESAATVSELRVRLTELPADLEQFFDAMFSSIDLRYLSQACQLFTALLETEMDISLLTASFLTRDDMNQVVNYIRGDPFVRIEEQLIWAKTRLVGVCKLFLEVQYKPKRDVLLSHTVEFLHRTVRDYLASKEKQAIRIAQCSHLQSIHHSLCHALLAQIKILDFTKPGLSSSRRLFIFGDFLDLLDDLFECALKIESTGNDTPEDVLDEVERVIQSYQRSATWKTHISQQPMIVLPRPEKKLRNFSLQRWQDWDEDHTSFLKLATDVGLAVYVRKKICSDPSVLKQKTGEPFLMYACFRLRESPVVAPPCQQLVDILLELGADPNQEFGPIERGYRNTVWGMVLRSVDFKDAELLSSFITHGANEHGCVLIGDDVKYFFAEPVIKSTFPPTTARLLIAKLDYEKKRKKDMKAIASSSSEPKLSNNNASQAIDQINSPEQSTTSSRRRSSVLSGIGKVFRRNRSSELTSTVDGYKNDNR